MGDIQGRTRPVKCFFNPAAVVVKMGQCLPSLETSHAPPVVRTLLPGRAPIMHAESQSTRAGLGVAAITMTHGCSSGILVCGGFPPT
jgi:hypothetical protein